MKQEGYMFNSKSGFFCNHGLIGSVWSHKLIATGQGWVLATVCFNVFFYNVINASIPGANMPKWELLTTVEQSTTVSHGSRCWLFFCWDEKGLIIIPTFHPIGFLYSPDCAAAAHLTDGRWKEEEQGERRGGVKTEEKEKLRGSAGPTERGRRDTAYSRTDR